MIGNRLMDDTSRKTSKFVILTVAFWMTLVFFSSNHHANAKPLKVFVLVGQSNMQGHADVRTFPHIAMDPATTPLLHEMQAEDGSPRVSDNVWISLLSSGVEKSGRLTVGYGASDTKIGPELTFGIYMHKQLGEPILIIKTAWGGKSLNTDFRSPSAGPYEFDETQLQRFQQQGKDVAAIKAEKAAATGLYYRLMIDHVQKVLADIDNVYPDYDAESGYELAGMVWFQGWNDMVDGGTYPNRDQPGGYDAYSTAMAHFIRDVRKDLSAPKLPFVIGVMGVGGPVDQYGPDQQRYRSTHQNFRDAMAAPARLPEFAGTVAAVLTEKSWDRELTELRAKESNVKQAAKKQSDAEKLSREESRTLEEKLIAEAMSPQEIEMLQTGVSNAEYHYLGSAKIMAQIGKSFAEAMGELLAK